MSETAAGVSRAAEPNALPHEVHCACCPRKITLLTRTYVPDAIQPNGSVQFNSGDELLARLTWNSFTSEDQDDFYRGMLLRVEVEDGLARLEVYTLPIQKSAHGRDCHRLPHFGLEVGKVIWICPTCEEAFQGHAFNVEQYLAERAWIFNHMGDIRFKLTNSM